MPTVTRSAVLQVSYALLLVLALGFVSMNGWQMRAQTTSLCGNGVINTGEECDDSSRNGVGPNCTTACRKVYCGDAIVTRQAGEECDTGSGASASSVACGGRVCAKRECDADGECGGGCVWQILACMPSKSSARSSASSTMSGSVASQSGAVKTSSGASASSASSAKVSTVSSVPASCIGKPYGTPGCPVKQVSPTCGNATVESGEDCDYGSARNGTGNCSKDCIFLSCGDGVLSPTLGEECEPTRQELYALDPVTRTLVYEAQYFEPSCGERCTAPSCTDDGVCTGGCKRAATPVCGESASSMSPTIAAASSAPTPTSQAIVPTTAQCGDGWLNAGEQCDDGNTVENDGCGTRCTPSLRLLPICGNGRIEGSEECDAGASNTNKTANACRTNCRKAFCGDAVLDTGEQCDDGNANERDGCTWECKTLVCGNGVVEAGEECDNGPLNSDTVPGSCRSVCRLAYCGDGMVDTAEECDDGNTIETDGCFQTCALNCPSGTQKIEGLCVAQECGVMCTIGSRWNAVVSWVLSLFS